MTLTGEGAVSRPGPGTAEEARQGRVGPGGHRLGVRPARRNPHSGYASSTPTPSTKQSRPLQRCLGRREHYTETHLAIAGLVSDRATER